MMRSIRMTMVLFALLLGLACREPGRRPGATGQSVRNDRFGAVRRRSTPRINNNGTIWNAGESRRSGGTGRRSHRG